MWDLKWSAAEKKIARTVFDEALEKALGAAMAGFKARAAAVSTPAEMWEVEDYLRDTRLEIGQTFDYRYSVLLEVFAILIRQGHLDEAALLGLSEEKRAIIRQMLSFRARS